MDSIKFTMAARCEAAGRPNNEDNFQLTDDLAGNQWSFKTNEEVSLGEKGALLIVCDGMGGMNAGEVASQIAVETVKEWFSPERLTAEVTATSESIIKYIENAIIAADIHIKEEGEKDKEKEGMGSTIVLAWIIGKSVFIGWCGDSRAYLFNPAVGLKRLSHDHSYVQTLVDSGQLTEELAFDHPNSNIVTRCLGDTHQTAKPDMVEHPLHDGDIILLCSDGLSGVLRDRVIQTVMSENAENMASCRDALWNAARNAGWHDNVTIGLCRIMSGIEEGNSRPEQSTAPQKTMKKRIWPFILGLVMGIIVGFVAKIAIERFL
ncbi:MAG: protein phosphatase 2C domain-containing protein [Bacteroidales bacterium]|jgi:serine/threonine protein phosphatase PrpC|nr:protein phosphatase 2C domain-containing protein [Bacteroidales bacterium]